MQYLNSSVQKSNQFLTLIAPKFYFESKYMYTKRYFEKAGESNSILAEKHKLTYQIKKIKLHENTYPFFITIHCYNNNYDSYFFVYSLSKYSCPSEN